MSNAQGEPIYDSNGARGFLAARTPSSEVVRLELETGAEIPEHALDMPVIFLVQSGTPTLLLTGKTTLTTPGTVMEVAPGISRGWRNEGPTTATVMAVKLIRD